MGGFLTPDHENELAGWLEEAHSQGATEQDLSMIRDTYLQDKAITDRNYGEMKKPSDAPVMKGGVARGIFGALRRAGEPITAMLSPDRLKTRVGNMAQDFMEGGPLNMIARGTVRDISEMGKGMLDQAGRYQGQVKERRGKGDELGADVALAQQALSLVPGVSQAVPLGEEFARTGDTANLGAAATDIAMAAAPKVLPPMGRAMKAGGNKIASSLFAPTNPAEMALADQAGASIASGSPVMGKPGLDRALMQREIKAALAATEAESRIAARTKGNQFGTRKAINDVKGRLRDTAGEIPGKEPGTTVAGDPGLAEALRDEISGLEAISKPGGRQLAEMLDYQRGLKNSGGQARDLTAGAIESEIGRVSPELASVRQAAADATAARKLPQARAPRASNSVQGTLSALHQILFSPAAKTMSAVTMNRLGQLMQRGDVQGALLLAQAATQQENQ
jgi:hypothetical protein